MSFHAIKSLLISGIISTIPLLSHAQEVKFHNEKSDTTRITSILFDQSAQKNPADIVQIAEKFIDTPYQSGTLDTDSIEILTVNLDAMDCTTFVETVLALAYTASEHRQSWHDFTYNLSRLRYRNGEVNGYPSRLHYTSDWIVDNVARGNIRDITRELPESRYAVKSLDYMSRNASLYPALSDSTNLAAIKNIEAGFSNHRYPYLKASTLNDKKLARILRPGDIICFTTSIRGLDVTHLAIATIIDGIPRIIHASSREGRVLLDPLPLTEYIRRFRPEGIRVLRLRLD